MWGYTSKGAELRVRPMARLQLWRYAFSNKQMVVKSVLSAQINIKKKRETEIERKKEE